VNYRRYILIALVSVGTTAFFASFGVFYHFRAVSPTMPITATGQVYPINDHGHFFYVTREHYWLFHILLSGWWLAALAAVLNYRWKVVPNLTRDGWRLPP